MKKIILVGYMASGKTQIGKLLAKKLDISFFDLDHLIENEVDKSVAEIFSECGEIYFRKKESEILCNKIVEPASFVLSLGGGTPCYANNHELLLSDDIISVYLKASIGTLTERLLKNKSTRPLVSNLSDNEISEFIAKHLFDRSFYYNQCKYSVVVDNKLILEIVNEIEFILNKHSY